MGAAEASGKTAGHIRALGAYGPLSKLCAWGLAARGWRVAIMEPLPEKCVIVAYPHTSNWDFVLGLAAKWATGITAERDALSFAGKESLFRWPWGTFFRSVGGFPVIRDKRQGFVEQMVAQFARTSRMRFTIAPEGTRRYVDHLRSSFYFIAQQAHVPIMLAVFDFANKQIVVTERVDVTGDVAGDMARIETYFRSFGVLGHTPENAAPWRFDETK